MDWQDSGVPPFKPLTDAELAEAMAKLDTSAAMLLLEEQTEVRRKYQIYLSEEKIRQEQRDIKAAEVARLEAERFEAIRLEAEAQVKAEAEARANQLRQQAEQEAKIRAEAEAAAMAAELRIQQEAEARARAEAQAAALAAELRALQEAEARSKAESAAAAIAAELKATQELAELKAKQAVELAQEDKAASPAIVTEPDLSFEELLGIVEEPVHEIAIAIETEADRELSFDELIGFPTAPAEANDTDIAASLNAMYGASANQPLEAEQAATELEEVAPKTNRTSNLVNDLIQQFGEDDEFEVASSSEAKPERVPKARPEGLSAWSLIANWNGSGALLLAVVCGYWFSSLEGSLGSLVLGGFVAFVVLGLVFAFSALAARRGKALQQILARAVFGVTGNVIPATILIITSICALAISIVSFSTGAAKFVPQLGVKGGYQVTLLGSSFSVPSTIFVVVLLLLCGTGLAWVRGRAIEVLRIIIAGLTGASLLGILAYAELSSQVAYRSDFGVNLSQALELASLIVVTCGLFFAIGSADENKRIRPTTLLPKFVAAGLINWLLAGLLALVAGFTLSKLQPQGTLAGAFTSTLLLLGAFALASVLAQTSNLFVGLRIREVRAWLRIVVSVSVLFLGAWLLVSYRTENFWQGIVETAPIAGVPVAAWLGLFTSDVMMRRTDYHLVSLEKNYGFYRGWNIANLSGYFVAVAVGLGFIESKMTAFSWLGYLAKLSNVSEQLLAANFGIWVALGIGFLAPPIFGIPRIRRQEAETLAIEARRLELAGVVEEPEL